MSFYLQLKIILTPKGHAMGCISIPFDAASEGTS